MVRWTGRIKGIRDRQALVRVVIAESNLRRPLADGRADGRTLANEVGAVRVGLEDGVGNDAAGSRAGAKMLDPSHRRLLGVIILPVEAAATNEEERNGSQNDQNSTASDNTTDDGDGLWVGSMRRRRIRRPRTCIGCGR